MQIYKKKQLISELLFCGTELKNDQTGEVVYTPPQSYDEIVELMSNLEKLINDKELCDCDPLEKWLLSTTSSKAFTPFMMEMVVQVVSLISCFS